MLVQHASFVLCSPQGLGYAEFPQGTSASKTEIVHQAVCLEKLDPTLSLPGEYTQLRFISACFVPSWERGYDAPNLCLCFHQLLGDQICQFSSITCEWQGGVPHFGQPPEKFGHWSYGLTWPPGRSWELVFIVHLQCAQSVGRGYGNCLPKSVSLLPQFLDSSTVETSITEVIPLSGPHRNLCIGYVDPLFLCPGKSCELESFLSSFCAELWGEAVVTIQFKPLSLFFPRWLHYASSVSLPRLARQKPVLWGSFCGKVGALDIQLTSFVSWGISWKQEDFHGTEWGQECW